MSNKKPHKHAELIKAWADGAEIQCYDTNPREHRWVDCIPQPSWYEHVKYRIKPEPKPDVVRDLFVEENEVHFYLPKKNLTLTFDGETGKLKSAEVL